MSAAAYAREYRREARDALLLVSLMRSRPPNTGSHARDVIAFAWAKADRASRNGGGDLPRTTKVLAAARAAEATLASDGCGEEEWRALVAACGEAHAELDASIDYTRPAEEWTARRGGPTCTA